MNKKERIQAAICGEAVDTIPYSLWTHMPGIDLDPDANAKKTIEFADELDLDLVKTMNNGMYAVEDFGGEVDYSEIEKGGVAKLVNTPIVDGESWKRLPDVDLSAPALTREIQYLKNIVEPLNKRAVPIVVTVFSPITIANKLAKNALMEHINQGYGKYIHQALKKITDITAKLAQEFIRLGADGIFLGSQISNYHLVSESLYAEFGMPYDLQVLEASSNGWCNILHAHGEDILFPLLRKYPAQIFNYHAWETLPQIDEALQLTGKCLLGGLQRMDITNGKRNELMHQIFQSLKLSGGRKIILAPGCVIRYPVDKDTLQFVRQTKVELESDYILKPV